MLDAVVVGGQGGGAQQADGPVGGHQTAAGDGGSGRDPEGDSGSGNNRDNLKKARGLLISAGWTPGTDRMLHNAKGEPLQIEFLDFEGGFERITVPYTENLKRIEKIVASLDVPPAGEAIMVPIRYASALDMVQIMGRLLADTPGAGGAAADAQQRVTLVADPRSNSVLVRGENASRVARARALIEQLDTPGRIGGNRKEPLSSVFVVR